MKSRGDYLFTEFELSSFINRQETMLRSEVNGFADDYLLSVSVEELCGYLSDKYHLETPALHEAGIRVEQAETSHGVVMGRDIIFYVPFEGNPFLLKCRPSTRMLSPPSAMIGEGQLVLTYPRADHDAAAARRDFDRDLDEIKKHLRWTSHDLAPYNEGLTQKARMWIQDRRSRLQKDREMVQALGFPLRRRGGAPETYAVPAVRRKPAVTKPAVTSSRPDPFLEMAEYEHILELLSQMARVLEMSPKAVQTMGEEDIRFVFLVPLNSHYEGQATGETFNFEGKTDILVRAEGKNIFIAECKFWDGPKSLHDAIEQLLGYTSWRDTKTAILVFNRTKNFSDVLAKIPDVVKAHSNFKRQEAYKTESGFRFTLHHRDDKNRELILTILAFEVPS